MFSRAPVTQPAAGTRFRKELGALLLLAIPPLLMLGTPRWLIEVITRPRLVDGLSRFLARPLRILHTASLAFADGDLSARAAGIRPGRRDEVAELVRAFNRMADRISALIQAQQRFIAEVFRLNVLPRR